MVAGYGDWKRKFGRHVKAGETGITILAPCPYWARDEVEETGPDGQTIKEQKWVKKTGFTTATVFDVSQTEDQRMYEDKKKRKKMKDLTYGYLVTTEGN